MRCGYKILLALLGLLVCLGFAESGEKNIVLRDDTQRINLGQRIKIFQDKSGKISFEEIRSGKYDRLFIHSPRPNPSFGFTDSVFWVSFTLEAQCSRHCQWLLELDYPLMDSFSAFFPDSRGQYHENKLGSREPFSARTIDHRNFIIKIAAKPGEKRTFYLRFKNKDRMEFPLTLWSLKEFNNHVYSEQYIIGIYYGILLVMFIYNLLLFLSLRDISYLYYIIYILAMAVFQLGQNGYLYQLLAKFTDPPPVHFISLTQSFLIAAILQFSQSFLNTRKFTRVFHTIMDVLKYIAIAYFFFPLFLDYTVCIQIGVLLTFIMIPVIIISGIIVMSTRYRPSYYYMAAWSVMFVAGFIFLLRVIAVLPHNTFTNYILHMGTAIEVVLWSIGLGDRYNLIKEERERIANEMQIARKIQGSLIPDSIPVVKGMAACSTYIPMDEVGGDLYDYHRIDDDKVGILVADVSGHGIPAALVASMVKIAFSLQINNAVDPQNVMKGMSAILQKELKDTFVTAAYTCFDMSKKELMLAKCGHLPLYVFRKNENKLEEIDPKGGFISTLPMREIELAAVPLREEDRVIMLTDGILECRNRDGEMWGFKRFENFVSGHRSLSADEFSKMLIRKLNSWSVGEGSFDDDITMIVIDIAGWQE